ncbi:carboxypeptidase regulatory-like domain-containing protein [Candidatus Berkelbacteria bacterium]|nr:carboxypeptidase regulatory-like domain-containing protein [Candidatus Berkelbacteria bacterium]
MSGQTIKRSLPLWALALVLGLWWGGFESPAVAQASHRPSISEGLKGRIEATVCEWNRRRTRLKCDRGPVSVTVIVSRAGQEVGRLRSDARGRYLLALPAGRYDLTAESDNLRVFPNRIVVEPDEVERVNLTLNGSLEHAF